MSPELTHSELPPKKGQGHVGKGVEAKGPKCARQGECVLFPCVFDCFGGWGQSAAETLPSLLRPAGRSMAETPTHAMPLVMQRLSFVLVRAVASVLLRQCGL